MPIYTVRMIADQASTLWFQTLIRDPKAIFIALKDLKCYQKGKFAPLIILLDFAFESSIFQPHVLKHKAQKHPAQPRKQSLKKYGFHQSTK
jgi:hypothetical protein